MTAKEQQASTAHIDVRYVANLARLRLDSGEVDRLQSQLDKILEHINQIQLVDVSKVDPTAHAISVQNVFRADTAVPGLDHETVMANAPAQAAGQFTVPKIVE